MANDLLTALRTYLMKVSSGEKSPQEVAAALNHWAKESGEAIKERVEEEIKSSAKKMGFAKQEDLDQLAREVELLKFKLSAKPGKKSSPKKKVPIKKSAKTRAKKKK